MGRNAKHTNTRLPLYLRILLIAGVTLACVGVAVFAVFFVAARGPWQSMSDRLCATLTEKNSIFTGVFFTSGEIQNAGLYMPPKESSDNANNQRTYLSCAGGKELTGDGWRGYITEVSSSSLMLAENSAGLKQGKLSLGLDGLCDALFLDGCLSYTGEGGAELYCFCGYTPDGKLHIGGMTVVEAANAGFKWGISASRVLVSGGVPQTSLKGGYASRAAIGQREDGTILIFAAEADSFWPCGISYDEMASVMYMYGAQNAAALDFEGALYIDGKLCIGKQSQPGYSLTAGTGEAEQ